MNCLAICAFSFLMSQHAEGKFYTANAWIHCKCLQGFTGWLRVFSAISAGKTCNICRDFSAICKYYRVSPQQGKPAKTPFAVLSICSLKMCNKFDFLIRIHASAYFKMFFVLFFISIKYYQKMAVKVNKVWMSLVIGYENSLFCVWHKLGIVIPSLLYYS